MANENNRASRQSRLRLRLQAACWLTAIASLMAVLIWRSEWLPPKIVMAARRIAPLNRLMQAALIKPPDEIPAPRDVPTDTVAVAGNDPGEQYEPTPESAGASPAVPGVQRPPRLLPEPESPTATSAEAVNAGVRKAAGDRRVVRTALEDAGAANPSTAQSQDEATPVADTRNGSVPAGSELRASQPSPLTEPAAIQTLIDTGDYVAAQRELSKWYWRTPDRRSQYRRQLDDLAKSLYFSPQPLFHEPYLVQPGDQLRVIAQRYKLSWQYLSRLNHVDPRKLRMGQKLKVVDGPFSALVSLSNFELIVHLNGSFVKSYRVGIGKEGTTPIGTFTVKNKLEDPTYFGPDGVVIAAEDPKNPLGERWIDIGDSYGIHGTIEPESIGRSESRGCIRMLNSDVEEVYDLLVIGSQVRILR